MKKVQQKFLFEDYEINSIASLIDRLKSDKEQLFLNYNYIPKIWFRGLKDIKRQILPTFYVENYKIKDEIYMMNLFKQNSHELINQTPKNEWEWMFLMRHYKLPSRLIDWTENPLIGLYFAVCMRESEKIPTTDGVFWCLLPVHLNNWALAWPNDDNHLPMFTENKTEYSSPENETISLYLPSSVQNVTSKEINMRPPAAGICPRTNQRMQAQFSVFTIHHANKIPLESAGDGTHIWRYRIPAGSKDAILNDLKIMGISKRTIFPELDNVSLEVCEYLRG